MTLSGPNETWWTGTWPAFRLPVLAWRVWTWEDESLKVYTSVETDWESLPDLVLAVCAYHPGGKRTFMRYKDAYPNPIPGPLDTPKDGFQIGEVGCGEWRAISKAIFDDPWRPKE